MSRPLEAPAASGLLLTTLLLLSGQTRLCTAMSTYQGGPQLHRIRDVPRGSFSSFYPSSSSSSSSSRSHGVMASEDTDDHNKGNGHLTLHGIEVPVYKFRGEDAELKCRYDRGSDPLYSVKWYKDDREFYRYLFKMQNPKTTFNTPGVTVDIRRSNEIKVLLRKLTFNSTGVYKCEVSADSPHFHTYEDQSVMVVVELPEQGPTIHGGRSHYRVGDVARLNCTSSKSKPAAQLTWFINEEKVSSPHLVEYYPWVHHDGLESRRLGLSFTVDKSHFLKGDLVLKCQATVAAIYTAIKEEDAIVSEGDPLILEQREQRILVRSAGSTVLPTSTVSVVLAILMGCQAVT